ncbi:hypothetical protein JKP88DRAFT_224838 [Tribonema minus]|uniref:Uncharacterized protein n=1 Tax=Tribonema minus TaxID=303371 RepID=A0A835YPE8_9STRA|nr:hypothetical protein JKP88DRAFT_224838 [Tribonema minus]
MPQCHCQYVRISVKTTIAWLFGAGATGGDASCLADDDWRAELDLQLAELVETAVSVLGNVTGIMPMLKAGKDSELGWHVLVIAAVLEDAGEASKLNVRQTRSNMLSEAMVAVQIRTAAEAYGLFLDSSDYQAARKAEGWRSGREVSYTVFQLHTCWCIGQVSTRDCSFSSRCNAAITG